MPYYIEINGVPNSPQRVILNGSSGGTIGSSRQCQIPISHGEVADQALLLDIRGDDFWVQNLNPYSIYVGVEEITPNAWAPWTIDETIQLTKSVSLTISEQEEEDETAAGEAKTKDGKLDLDASKITQIALIALCVIGAPLILLSGNKDDIGGEIDNRFNFNQVVLDLKPDAERNIEYDTVRKYLQQAWMADRRFRNRNPAIVRKTYELLVNHRLVRENPDNRETIKAIEEYSKRRLASLRFRQ